MRTFEIYRWKAAAMVPLRWLRMPWPNVTHSARRKAQAAGAMSQAEERAAALGRISVLARSEPDPARTLHRPAPGRTASTRLGEDPC